MEHLMCRPAKSRIPPPTRLPLAPQPDLKSEGGMPPSKPFTALVCKRKDSPYKVTEPSRYWIKVKNSQYSQLEGAKSPARLCSLPPSPPPSRSSGRSDPARALARQV